MKARATSRGFSSSSHSPRTGMSPNSVRRATRQGLVRHQFRDSIRRRDSERPKARARASGGVLARRVPRDRGRWALYTAGGELNSRHRLWNTGVGCFFDQWNTSKRRSSNQSRVAELLGGTIAFFWHWRRYRGGPMARRSNRAAIPGLGEIGLPHPP